VNFFREPERERGKKKTTRKRASECVYEFVHMKMIERRRVPHLSLSCNIFCFIVFCSLPTTRE